MGINKKTKVTFRTTGGENIGYGHYYRCLSLAKSLLCKNDKIKIFFIVNEGLKESITISGYNYMINNDFNKDISVMQELNPDIIIFDSYLSNNKYLKALSNISKLAVFDDNNNIYDSSIPDLIINGNIYADELKYKERADGVYLLGTDYLVMKEEYWGIKDNTGYTNKKNYNIMITTGGSDINKISYKILKTLLDTSYEKNVIIGPSYSQNLIKKLENLAIGNDNINLIYKPNSLKKYIENADVIITAGGSTVYEILCHKKASIVFSWADNQDLICKRLKENGIPYIGKFPNIKYNSIISELNKIFNDDIDKYKKNKGFDLDILIDGKGALRVAEILLKII